MTKRDESGSGKVAEWKCPKCGQTVWVKPEIHGFLCSSYIRLRDKQLEREAGDVPQDEK